MDEQRLARVESDVADVKQSVAIIEDRQSRMHSDFNQLTVALNENTAQIASLNLIFANKKGFITGAVAAFTILGGLVGTLTWAIVEWASR